MYQVAFRWVYILLYWLLSFVDILISEFTDRFQGMQSIMPALNVLPSAVVSPAWRSECKLWIENVTESLRLYKDILPCAENLETELISWRQHWCVSFCFWDWFITTSIMRLCLNWLFVVFKFFYKQYPLKFGKPKHSSTFISKCSCHIAVSSSGADVTCATFCLQPGSGGTR